MQLRISLRRNRRGASGRSVTDDEDGNFPKFNASVQLGAIASRNWRALQEGLEAAAAVWNCGGVEVCR